MNENRRKTDRRVSPAVGEFAIQERERLRQRNAKLEKALDDIKALVVGEAKPNWYNSPETTRTRMRIADICDIAMGNTS